MLTDAGVLLDRPAVPVPPSAVARHRALPWLAWIVLLPLCFAVYATSFAGIPVLERRHSVLGDADAANFAVLLRDFSLSRKYGNEYASVGRTLGDNAQKHKIHHVAYAAVGGTAYRLARPVYRALGIPAERALYAVNALVTCANLLLVALLLRRFNPHRNPTLPFLVLYATALSTWVFGSVPESWPFSGTLVLGFLLLLGGRPLRPTLLGGVLGLILLNNIFLVVLLVPLGAALLRAGHRGLGLLGRAASAGAAMLATWAVALSALSLLDDSLRPDHFVRFTLWFRQFAGNHFLPPYAPFVWESAGTNLFVNSVVSNQGDPAVPQEALLATLTTSVLGAVAVLLFVAVLAVAAVGLVRETAGTARRAGWGEALREPALDLPLWCLTMLLLTVLVFYPSGFLYSTVVVPALVVALCRYLDLRVRYQWILLHAALLLIVVNNLSQVLRFRHALLALS
jgi:hypothetical protein